MKTRSQKLEEISGGHARDPDIPRMVSARREFSIQAPDSRNNITPKRALARNGYKPRQLFAFTFAFKKFCFLLIFTLFFFISF